MQQLKQPLVGMARAQGIQHRGKKSPFLLGYLHRCVTTRNKERHFPFLFPSGGRRGARGAARAQEHRRQDAEGKKRGRCQMDTLASFELVSLLKEKPWPAQFSFLNFSFFFGVVNSEEANSQPTQELSTVEQSSNAQTHKQETRQQASKVEAYQLRSSQVVTWDGYYTACVEAKVPPQGKGVALGRRGAGGTKTPHKESKKEGTKGTKGMSEMLFCLCARPNFWALRLVMSYEPPPRLNAKSKI